jgi:hypothetical protein
MWSGQVWWYIPVIPTLRPGRRVVKFLDSLSHTARQNKKIKKKKSKYEAM